MPKQKPTKQQQKVRQFQATVAKQLIVLDYSKDQQARILRLSRSTLWNRLQDPTQFRICELQSLHDVLNFTDEERHIIL